MMKVFRKILTPVLLIALILGFTACTGKNNNNVETTSAPAATTDSKATEPVTVESVNVEIMLAGWVNQPVPDKVEENPYKKYIMENYNINLTLMNTAEFKDQILVRFASNSPPDIIAPDTIDIIKQLHGQGVLLEDWNQLMDKLPSVDKRMTEEAKKLFTVDGKLIAVADAPEPSIWGWKIRQDWLKNLNLAMPTTTEELLNVGRAFTLNDPDKNGKNDTYGFTTAAGGKGIGDLFILQDMFGPDNFYVAADVTVKHPIIDGNKKKFLDFMKTIVKEKLIDPDWATQSWDVKNTKLYNKEHPSIGICYFPGVLVMETEKVYEDSGATLDWFASLDTPKGSDIGGKTRPGALYSAPKTVSAVAAKDSAKMQAILKFLDGINYPNDSYFALRWGQKIDPSFILNGIKGMDDYFYCYWGEDSFTTKYPGAWDYGKIIANRGDNVIQGTPVIPEPGAAVLKNIELDKTQISFPQYDAASSLLSLNPENLTKCKDLQDEFEIKYILGKTDDYDGFVQNWLKVGGQSLIDEAANQYKFYGYIK